MLEKGSVFLDEKPVESVGLGGGMAFDNRNLLRTLQMKENT